MHRRHFLAAAALALVSLPRTLRAGPRRGREVTHPDPRPGITAEHVLAEDAVPEKSRKAYAAARAHPAVLDGLYCHCDCAERDGMRSLLECFESKMPTTCGICRGEAELAGRLAGEGKTLDEIRKAVDERYG